MPTRNGLSEVEYATSALDFSAGDFESRAEKALRSSILFLLSDGEPHNGLSLSHEIPRLLQGGKRVWVVDYLETRVEPILETLADEGKILRVHPRMPPTYKLTE